MRTHTIHKQAPLMRMIQEPEKQKTYRIRFKEDGKTLTSYVWAYSHEDARLKAGRQDIEEIRQW